MTVTSAQVAQRAGVSQATVSYVLNDTPGHTISAATRTRVLRAANQLGYRPNAAARSLRIGRGEAVLFPLPGAPQSHVLTQMIDACGDALQSRGLTLVTDTQVYASLDDQLDAWSRVNPAAVMDLLIPHDDPVLPELAKRGVSVLSAGSKGEPSWESSGDAFAIEARKTQLRYLIERGHRTIATASPPALDMYKRVERELIKELRAIAKASGCELVVEKAALTARALRALVARWVASGPPDAVATINDDYAIALIAALAAEGIRVPDDVAVMGVDNTPLGASFTPALTTIAANFTAFADALASTMVEMIGKRSRSAALPTPDIELVVRESA